MTVQVKQRGEDGKLTGELVASDVDRNTWQVIRLERVRKDARAQLSAGVPPESAQPVVKVYDVKAPRTDQIDVPPAPTPERQRGHEPDVRR